MIGQRVYKRRSPIVARRREAVTGSESAVADRQDSSRIEASVERPLVVDLFAGVGGLALGFEQARCDVVAAVEFDRAHTTVHKLNFPRTELIAEDVSKVKAAAVRAAACRGASSHGRAGPWDGTIDILIGGPPCQGFSAGGRH